MNKVIIVDTVRTGITKSFRGKLRDTRPDDIAARCIDSLFDRNPGLDREEIDDCVVGCAFPEGAQGMNLGRNVAVLSKLSTGVSGMTVNRYCASGLQAIASAANQIKVGSANIIAAGGVESISMTLKHVNSTYLYNDNLKTRAPGMYLGMDTKKSDAEFIKNVFTSMGHTAEVIADKYGITRVMQDEYSEISQTRTNEAQIADLFNDEIIEMKVNIKQKIKSDGGFKLVEKLLTKDECNRPNTTKETLSMLNTSFIEGGTVTAGNSSQITDGGCMSFLASEDYVQKNGLNSLGYFHGYTTSGCLPEEMGSGPIQAIKKLFNIYNLSMADIDLFEMNEAFAASTVHCQRELGIDIEKLNVNGGAISIGHPFGMTGARQVGHILRELRRRDKKFGVITMCIGGGMGIAALVERI